MAVVVIRVEIGCIEIHRSYAQPECFPHSGILQDTVRDRRNSDETHHGRTSTFLPPSVEPPRCFRLILCTSYLVRLPIDWRPLMLMVLKPFSNISFLIRGFGRSVTLITSASPFGLAVKI